MKTTIKNKELKANIIKYNIITSLFTWILILGIATILLVSFRNKLVEYQKLISLINVGLLIYALLDTLIFPFIEVNTWAYEITEKKIEYVFGVYNIKSITIPITRIQHVTTESNPLLNYFGISKVQINTTSGDHYLKNIAKTDGDKIVKHITDILFKERESTDEK